MSWKTSLGCSLSNAFPLRQNRFVDYPQRRNCAPRRRKSPFQILHRSATFLLRGNVHVWFACLQFCFWKLGVSYGELESWVFHQIIFMDSTWECSPAANQICVQVEAFPFAGSFNHEWNEVEFKRFLIYAFFSYFNWIRDELSFDCSEVEKSAAIVHIFLCCKRW